jgi:hypothetical protein
MPDTGRTEDSPGRAMPPSNTSAFVSLYYWCLSRDLLNRWLQGLHGANPDSEHLGLNSSSLGRSDEELTTVVDVSAHVELCAEPSRSTSSEGG